MNRRKLDLWHDIKGASVIETALIFPILSLLACGSGDVGLGFAEKMRAQQGADRAVQFALNKASNHSISAPFNRPPSR